MYDDLFVSVYYITTARSFPGIEAIQVLGTHTRYNL
jgi:hypothetical protein